MAQLDAGTTYATGSEVNALNLNAHVTAARLLSGAITEQTLASSVGLTDNILISQAGALKKATVTKLLENADLPSYVKKNGTVAMTAELTLSSSTPAAALSAASKGYVDASVVALLVPSGAIMIWPSSNIPSGWIECNGQSTSGFTALAAIVGSTVPDLRGEFVRGWDHGKNVDTGRTIKSSQSDSIQNISGQFAIGGTEQQVYGATGSFYDTGIRGGGFGTGHDNNPTNPYVGFDASRQVRTSTETRPRNIALMYIIKT